MSIQIDAIENQIAEHEETLNGSNGIPGVTYKVNVMWRIHVWVLCTLSCGVGVIATELIHKYINK